ncbi:MAG: DUF1570 domain-containing protein [Vicinamibacterales bacterium]
MRQLFVAMALMVLAAPIPVAAQTWLRVQSPHFTFVGDARERDIRRVAEQLERFRGVMLATLTRQDDVSPVPTVVVVFASDRSFRPYQPRFEGRRVEVAGYFLNREDINYLAINGSLGYGAIQTVFHEYTHFVMSSLYGRLPTWLNEGLAEYYEALEERDGGRTVILGRAPSVHLDPLTNVSLIPLAQLLAVDQSSPLYNEGSRRGVFYAQSWALTHYLLLGSETRRAQFTAYLGLLGSGTPSVAAFAQAFGDDLGPLETELREYVRRFSFPAQSLSLSGGDTETAISRGERLTPSVAQGYLGDLLARVGHTDEARTLLQRTIETDTTAARARAALGLLDLRTERVDEGLVQLEEAARLDADDPWISVALGQAYVERTGRQDDTAAQMETLRLARVPLARAVARDPDVAHASALLGAVEARLGERPDDALRLLVRAVQLAPARDYYRLLLAEALARARDYDRATQQLGVLLAGGGEPEFKEQARRMLAQVAELRRAVLDAQRAARNPSALPSPDAGPGVSRVPDTPGAATAASAGTASSAETAASPTPASPSTPTPDGAGTGLTDAVPATSAPPGSSPILRPVGAGETRASGVFTGVVCLAGGIELVFETANGTLWLAALAFTDVDFISHRADAPAAVGCGPLARPMPALATYRTDGPTRGTAGIVVAVEVVPDGFVPR